MDDLICGYELDSFQKDIVLNNNKHVLVVAGAGSGKTLTILGKINYLIKYLGVKEDEIICISFTNKTCDSLMKKLSDMGYSVNVYTFHKLALEILSSNSFYYDIADDDLLDSVCNDFFIYDVVNYSNFMKYVMNYFNCSYSKNIKDDYLVFLSKYHFKLNILKRNIVTFLNFFKCNGFALNDFVSFYDMLKTGKYGRFRKAKLFLIFCINIYIKYNDYMSFNNLIDFDDMIIKATDCVVKNGFKNIVKYIIIDEYQDTSYIRFCLINEIIRCTSCNLLVVGDDFQSIYKFSGCCLDLFINFEDYFNDCKVLKLENTYRNSQELIDLAGSFIMKNKKQIKKNLVSKKRMESPIKIVYYDDIVKDFKVLIESIYDELKVPIMILGRNNEDINMVIDDSFLLDGEKVIYSNNKSIELYYMTVHKAKGLEEEVVIVINLDDRYLGFPNKIKEEKVLRLVFDSYDSYHFAEERRLFYVAITRTRGYCYLFSNKKKPSIFVKEMERMIKKKRLS